jgi:cytochrome b
MAAATDDDPAGPPSLWDPVVRLTHWALAAVVLANAVLTEGGSLIHIWIGWAGLAVLVLRLVWGLLGPGEARLAAFPPDPAGAIRHLRALAAGLMVYALWATLAVLIGTGIAMTGTGPLGALERQQAIETQDWSTLDLDGGDEREDGEDSLPGEVHEVAANLILVLAGLHVAGVVVEGRLSGASLIGPMLTGRRNRRRPAP